MFGRILSYIDSLFYTTTITTTIRTTTTVYHPLQPVERCETSVVWEGDKFIINNKEVMIPEVVKSRSPLYDPAGFPHYRDLPILVHISSEGGFERLSVQFVDDVKLSRQTKIGDYGKTEVIRKITSTLDESHKDSFDGMVTHVSFEELDIELSMTDNWMILRIEDIQGRVFNIYHHNPQLSKSDTECVIGAYAYARNFLVNASRITPDHMSIDEDQLATTFLAMMLADRV